MCLEMFSCNGGLPRRRSGRSCARTSSWAQPSPAKPASSLAWSRKNHAQSLDSAPRLPEQFLPASAASVMAAMSGVLVLLVLFSAGQPHFVNLGSTDVDSTGQALFTGPCLLRLCH